MKHTVIYLLPLLLLSLLTGTARTAAPAAAAVCDHCREHAAAVSCCSDERQPDEMHHHGPSTAESSPCAHGGWCRDDNPVPPAMVSVVSVEFPAALDSVASLCRALSAGFPGNGKVLTPPAGSPGQLFLLNCSFLI